jgi:hypothetical protein
MHIDIQQQRIVEEAAKIAEPLGEEYKVEARKIRLPYHLPVPLLLTKYLIQLNIQILGLGHKLERPSRCTRA